MNDLLANHPETFSPTPADVALAVESSRQLARIVGNSEDLSQSVSMTLQGSDSPIELSIPVSALRLLGEVLTQMAQGNAVTLIPFRAELTTQQAADLLGVSRPFLVAQVDAGELPSRKVGTHRRVFFKDVLVYKQAMDSKRLEALGELAKQAQELDMGY